MDVLTISDSSAPIEGAAVLIEASTLTPEIVATLEATAMDKTARALDINGWIEVKGNPLSKVGVYGYRGNQLPNAPDPTKVYQVYRPAEELSDPECIASFRLLPWIDNHIMLGSEDDGLMPAEKKGVQGVVGENVYFADGTLYGNLKVFSQSLANLIEAGKRELSCGYRCVYEWTSGVFEGKPYDAIQRKIRGNHLALVESGRMGPGVAVLDGSALDHFTFTIDAKDSTMADEVNPEESAVTKTMTLEEGLEAFKAFLPTLMLLQSMVTPTANEAAAEVLADLVVVADADKDAGKEDAKSDDKTDDEAKKAKPFAKAEDAKPVIKAAIKEIGMDAKEVYKTVAKEIAARDRLYDRVSVHVGAFDHSEMTEAEVATYGAKKLNLKAAPGQEHAVLSGYLQAAKDPRKEVAVMDSAAPADNAVSRFLKNKGQ